MLLYSILDVKANAFGRILEARTDDEAVRTFLMIIQQSTGNDLLGQFPQDFALYRLADFNQVTGDLVPDVQPYHLISGLEAVQMLRSQNNTCSECAVHEVSDESNVVALKSHEEEVND